jgi:DNA polymerase
MSEQRELLTNLKQLLELDQAAGIEFVLRTTSEVTPVPRPPVSPAIQAATTPISPPVAPAAEATAAALTPTTVAENLDSDSLAKISEEIAACKACRLCEGRRHTVPGEGNPRPVLLFIGEGPGADEDAQGRPFVGAAGQLLDKMIVAMGLKREEVFIANIIKCRPPGNRTPETDEVTACLSFLKRQIAVLQPSVICALGNTPLRALTGNEKAGITRLRGQRLTYNGITMIPTFHPSFLLRNPDAKKPCWEDLQTVLAIMGRTLPKRS